MSNESNEIAKKEKVIFVDESEIRTQLQEIDQLKEIFNKTYSLLNEFGIEDPEAVKTPIESVNNKLTDSINVKEGLEVSPIKIAELVGKDKIYRELINLDKNIVNNPLSEKIRWNKKSFSINSSVKEELTRELSVVITDPEQIQLADRIETFVMEAEILAIMLGKRSIPMNLIRILPGVLMYKNQKVGINHRTFIRLCKELEIGENISS